MLNTKEEAVAFKKAAYGAFSEVARAMGNPRRLELLDLLIQGPRSVDGLARGTHGALASTSQQLQVLKRARLVLTERRGTTIEYRLAPGVAEVFVSLRRLAHQASAELRSSVSDFHERLGVPETIGRGPLTELLGQGRAVLLDVRPVEEYLRGHLPGALSFPIEELPGRLDEVPPAEVVVATCRGPYCVFAAQAVALLREHGRSALRFEDGVADWVFDGGVLA